MGKVVVFDSGLGSLSIIQAIRKTTKTEIIYFADQKHYPYGTKSKKELGKIIKSTIISLQKQFQPDIIIVGSNTPTILFPELFVNETIVGVVPPLSDAAKKTKTNSIAVLGTLAMIKSKQLSNYIDAVLSKNILVTTIDATKLIDLVETGQFLNNVKYSRSTIQNILTGVFFSKQIDTVTLSSTHLSFLSPLLKEMFPMITFLDPADSVAQKTIKKKNFHSTKKNSLKIFASGNVTKLQNNLAKLQIKNKVHHLEL